jgi:hypothetical protein
MLPPRCADDEIGARDRVGEALTCAGAHLLDPCSSMMLIVMANNSSTWANSVGRIRTPLAHAPGSTYKLTRIFSALVPKGTAAS